MPSTLPTLGKEYYITAKHSGQVLAVNGGSKDNGANIIQSQTQNFDYFKWRLEDAGDGYRYIVAKHSNKPLAVNGGSKNNGGDIIQWDNQKYDYFKWQLKDAGDGYFYLVAKHSNQALAVNGASKDNGASIVQWGNQELDHFKWKFEDAALPILGKEYYITAKHSGQVLAVNGASKDNGADIVQLPAQNLDHFKWRLEDAGDGYRYIVAKHSNKPLVVNGGNKDNGGDIIQWDNQKYDYFKWQLKDAGDGYFYLIAKHSSQALAVNGASKDSGADIVQWGNQELDHFKWKFEDKIPETIAPITPPSLPPISDNGTIKTEAGKTYKVQITVDVSVSNSYNNTFGIFAINDDGSVAGVKPTDANYAQTVVKNRVPITAADEGSYKKGQTFQYELPGGPTYSVFLIANGTPALFLEKNPLNQGSKPPLAYFFDTAANPDGKSHIKKISSTQYGFEDFYGGGDQDFDDVIVKIEKVPVESKN